MPLKMKAGLLCLYPYILQQVIPIMPLENTCRLVGEESGDMSWDSGSSGTTMAGDLKNQILDNDCIFFAQSVNDDIHWQNWFRKS